MDKIEVCFLFTAPCSQDCVCVCVLVCICMVRTCVCTHQLHDSLSHAQSLRQTVLRSLLSLSSPPSDSQVREAAACHLRRGREDYLDIGTCEMCRAEDVVVQYGHRLFIDYMHQEEVELRSTGQGSRRIGLFEVALKSISAFARRRRAPRALQKASQAYLGYVDALRREYEGMRALWIAEGERIGACDELLMSSTRLRVMNTHEMLLAYLDMDIPFIVHPLEVSSVHRPSPRGE